MTVIQSIILGIIQGLAEFLPVSSSGHLVIVPWLLGWPAPSVTFDAFLHLGTVAAILVAFWKDIINLLRAWFRSILQRGQSTTESRMVWLLVISAIPAAILGFLLNDLFESIFGTPRLVAVLLLVTAVILVVSERLSKRTRSLNTLRWPDALLMGVAQGIAIAPGISRSGATLATGLLRGLKREEAARFSFLMAIPVIVGAAGYKLIKTPIDTSQVISLVAGFAAAMATGFLVIRMFLTYLRNHSLNLFAIYCLVAGAATLAFSFVRL